jgi:hypothetical protein
LARPHPGAVHRDRGSAVAAAQARRGRLHLAVGGDLVGQEWRFYDAGMSSEAAGGGVLVGLLGPVEIGPAGGMMAEVPQPQLRVLLGLLAVAAGRVVSEPALMDGVWGEAWPPGRQRNLHALVYQLRRRLAALEPGAGPGGGWSGRGADTGWPCGLGNWMWRCSPAS